MCPFKFVHNVHNNPLFQVEGALDEATKDSETVWENAAVGEVIHRIAGFLQKGEVGRAKGLIASAKQHFDGRVCPQICKT